MNRTIFIFILVLVLVYINYSTEHFDSFDNEDNIIIIVYDEQFYYLNIKNNETNRYDVYRIPLYLIKNFFE